MKIIVAPDSYKGNLTAAEVAECIERGIRKVFQEADIIKVPMADGGEGTVQSLVDGTSGEIVKVVVKDPLMRNIEAFYGILGDRKTAVIEIAAASGLPLLCDEEKNPMVTTTYGTGELIRHALDRGCKNIILGLGGSATNDGGLGMAEALGVKFLDENHEDIGFGGGSLGKLKKIDISELDPRIKNCTIIAACDVENPLCGPTGASYIFGPQKGADEEMVKILDNNLAVYAELIKKEIGIDIKDTAGAGAAGGLGAGLMAFLNAEMKKGIDIVIEILELEKKLKDADLVITGEGMIDYQTAYGKTPYGVAMTAKKYNIPVIAIAGGIGKDAKTLYAKGFDSIFSTVDNAMTLEKAIAEGNIMLEKTAERIMRVFRCAISLAAKKGCNKFNPSLKK